MRCICKNCKHCYEHDEGKLCAKHIMFVHDEDCCPYFKNDELFNTPKFVALAIVAIGIMLLFAKFL